MVSQGYVGSGNNEYLEGANSFFRQKSSSSPLQQLPIEEIKLLEDVAWECAHLFQPSSSCVEGRKAQLALRHHALHRLSDRKLQALKVVHNFYLRRDDGITAAERFFNASHKELFAWLLDRVDIPGFPAQKRPKTEQKISLTSLEMTVWTKR